MSGKKYPYYPFWVYDYNSDPLVLAMTDLQDLAYRRMLDQSWDLGPLPNDPKKISLLIRFSLVRFKRVWGYPLTACWKETAEGLVNPRLEKVRLETSKRYERSKKGWQASVVARQKTGPELKLSSSSKTAERKVSDPEPDPDVEERSYSNIRSSIDPTNLASYGVLPGAQPPSGPTTQVTGRVRWNEEKQKFDPSVKFKAEFLACWRKEFTDDDIVEELKKASRWLVGRPDRRSSRNRLDRFLHNWMARALADRKEQDAGETEAAPPERPEDRWCVKCREVLPEHLRWCPERREPNDVT